MASTSLASLLKEASERERARVSLSTERGKESEREHLWQEPNAMDHHQPVLVLENSESDEAADDVLMRLTQL